MLSPIPLLAVTTNPVAPLRHRFDPHELRARIAAELPGVPVLDVLPAPARDPGLASALAHAGPGSGAR